MKRIMHIWQWIVAATLLFSAVSSTLVADDLSDAEYRRLQKLLRPDDSEPWRTIPWKIGLLDAQHTAARENKPIFIWAMDGHPLGCT